MVLRALHPACCHKNKNLKKNIMETTHLPLGKKVSHSVEYDAGQLCPVPRILARHHLGLKESQPLPFKGEDIWTAYELSWLNSKGKPLIAIGELRFPATSPNIIESKSLKLYCNSFNQTRFDSFEAVKNTMETDLTRIAGEKVTVQLIPPQQFNKLAITAAEGECIDHLDIGVEHYSVHPELLKCGNKEVTQELYSDLLRTNCPVTNQPDWATIVISYQGHEILKESLLAYLISYRQHTGFHENCVESIFTDIMAYCQPNHLTVYARFTRRGGLDINPYRTTRTMKSKSCRLARQ